MTRNADSPACARNQRTRQVSMHVGRRQRVADGGQTSVPWRLLRSVINAVGPAGAESS
jgi:hypothetical protein